MNVAAATVPARDSRPDPGENVPEPLPPMLRAATRGNSSEASRDPSPETRPESRENASESRENAPAGAGGNSAVSEDNREPSAETRPESREKPSESRGNAAAAFSRLKLHLREEGSAPGLWGLGGNSAEGRVEPATIERRCRIS